jgi:hypothetical protein
MFLLQQGHVVMDVDLDLLVEMLVVVDGQVAAIESQLRQSSDPDGAGLLDRMEGIVGLGFVACQQYLNATWGQLAAPRQLVKWAAIALPPTHVCGRSYAEITDAVANYWKHHDEWPHSNERKRVLKDRTLDVIASLGSPASDYVVGNALVRLTSPRPARFASLVLELTKWRNEHIQWPA